MTIGRVRAASIQNLISCSRDTGNYLLNIGPRADGSVPEESVRVLTEVGQWMRRNGDSMYASDPCQPRRLELRELHAKGHHTSTCTCTSGLETMPSWRGCRRR